MFLSVISILNVPPCVCNVIPPPPSTKGSTKVDILGLICSLSPRSENAMAGTSCKEKFQTEFVVDRGGFLSYWNHQLIKFEEEKRFRL